MRAHILNHEVHPEGLDVDRIRFIEAGDSHRKRAWVTSSAFFEEAEDFTWRVTTDNPFT